MKFSSTLTALLIVTVLLATILDSVLKKSKLPKYKIAIGILSARENFAQRNAIRSTWLSVLKDSKLSEEVFVAFFLASEDCDVPVKYRRSEYSCEEVRYPTSVSIGVYDILGDSNFPSTEEFPDVFTAVAFDFVVTHDVVISGFSVPNRQGKITNVQLWDLASIVLVVETSGKDHGFWNSLETEDYLLPRRFVGSVVVTCGSNPCVGVKNWFNHSSLKLALEISPIVRYATKETEFPVNILPTKLEEMLFPATLLLKVADPNSVGRMRKERLSCFKERQKQSYKILTEIEEESKKHGDIRLLPDVDGKGLKEVYRNLPRKLAGFHKWCHSNVDAEFVMKTDDDSFVDIENVLQVIRVTESMSSNKLWVGNFRRDWPVDRYGKWAEYQYVSPVYPAYACGAGNILSAAVSGFLADSTSFLRFYQGEDVSLGIWLSALDIRYVQDHRFVCDDFCDASMVVSTQHSVSSLQRLWRNKANCNNACACD